MDNGGQINNDELNHYFENQNIPLEEQLPALPMVIVLSLD